MNEEGMVWVHWRERAWYFCFGGAPLPLPAYTSSPYLPSSSLPLFLPPSSPPTPLRCWYLPPFDTSGAQQAQSLAAVSFWCVTWYTSNSTPTAGVSRPLL